MSYIQPELLPQVQFSADIPSPPPTLINEIVKFENWKNYFKYIKEVKSNDTCNNQTTIDIVVSFELNKFSHQIPICVTLVVLKDLISGKVISGPLKNTTFELKFETIEMGSKIYVNADWNVSLKYKFLIPIIKPRVKNAIIAIFYKIHTESTKELM